MDPEIAKDQLAAFNEWISPEVHASHMKPLLDAVKLAVEALRGVETGCDPLSVPLEPMANVRAAIAALEKWAR